MYEYIGILLGARPVLHISRIKVKILREQIIINNRKTGKPVV
jgi:hypothetical protein